MMEKAHAAAAKMIEQQTIDFCLGRKEGEDHLALRSAQRVRDDGLLGAAEADPQINWFLRLSGCEFMLAVHALTVCHEMAARSVVQFLISATMASQWLNLWVAGGLFTHFKLWFTRLPPSSASFVTFH